MGLSMARMALNEAAARRAGNYDLADYWSAEVQRESDRLEREAHAAEWDVLKGSPEHDGRVNG